MLRYLGTQCRWCPYVLKCIVRTALPLFSHLWLLRLITDPDQAEEQEAPDINTSIQAIHANGRQQSSLLMKAMVVCDNKGPTHTALHAECTFLSVICFCSSFPAALLRLHTTHRPLLWSWWYTQRGDMIRWWRSDSPDTMPWTHCSSLAAKPQTTACHTILSVNMVEVSWNPFLGYFESNTCEWIGLLWTLEVGLKN